MEYKIRANNQKEAVEVYKAIRQIQQGKHNIAVNADRRKDAVRIYKEAKRVCDSKIKDKQNLIKGDWFVFRSDILSDLSHKPIYLYKVLDTDLNRGNNISVDTYVISLGTDGKLRLKRYTVWGSSVKVDKDIVKFNSADEALKWAKQKVATYNSKR